MEQLLGDKREIKEAFSINSPKTLFTPSNPLLNSASLDERIHGKIRPLLLL